MSVFAFMSGYCLIKIIKTTVIASPFMLFVLFACMANRGRYAYANIGLLALVPVLCFTAYSRLFLSGRLLYLSYWLIGAVKPVHGVCYIGIMGLLAMVQVFRYIRWRKCKRGFDLCEDGKVFDLFHALIADPAIGRSRRTKRRLDRCSVYVTSQISSPVSGGLFRPYIILPRNVVETWKESDLRIVLNHELLHISSGHIWLLFFYNIMKLYWWINPLVYLCDRQLRINMEYTCDVGSTIINEADACMYGQLMLKMVRSVRGGKRPYVFRANMVQFANQEYRELKNRIIRIGKNAELSDASDAARKERYCRRHRCAVAGILCAVVVMFALVCATSYPRYWVDEEICLLDADLEIVAADIRTEGFDVSTEGGCLKLDSQCLAALAERYDLEGEYIFFSYDTVMKAPGAGGLGQVAAVSLKDGSICYLARNNAADRIQRFLFRFLI